MQNLEFIFEHYNVASCSCWNIWNENWVESLCEGKATQQYLEEEKKEKIINDIPIHKYLNKTIKHQIVIL